MIPDSQANDATKSLMGSYDFSEQVGHLLRKAYQRHLAIFQQHSCDPQLTAVQFVTLCALREHGACSQTELVKATAVDQATIRGIINRLKSRDLIALAPDADDRRKVITSITKKGEELLEEMIPRAMQITELTLNGLNPAERIAILFLLGKLSENDNNNND